MLSSTPNVSPAELPGFSVRPGLVFIIGALSTFGPLSMDMYLPALPSLSGDLGATPSEGQLTITTCLLGLALGQLIAGPVSDTLGRRGPLLVGLVAFTAASALCSLAPSAPVLIVLRLLQGLAGGGGIVISRAAVRDLYSGADVAKFLALTSLVGGSAPILAPVIGAQLLNFMSWRGVFLVLAAIGMGLVLVGIFGFRETLPSGRRTTSGIGSTLSAFRQLVTDRLFMAYTLPFGLVLATMFAYIAGSPFVLEGIFGVSPQTFSFIFGFNAVGIIAGSQISGALATRIDPGRQFAIGLGISMVGALLLLVATLTNIGLAGVLPAFFLVVFSAGVVSTSGTALALADHPRIAGSAAALLGVVPTITGAAAAPLVGIGGATTAVPMGIVIAFLSLAATCVYLLLAGAIRAEQRATAGRSEAPLLMGQRSATGMLAVTISREYGSGGGEVAARLADQLGWQLVDHEIVARVAQALGVSEDEAAAHDERPADSPQLQQLDTFQAILALPPVNVPVDLPTQSPAYDAARRRVIEAAVSAGRVVIVGRGAQVLLSECRDVLHVRLFAPIEDRVAYVVQREGLAYQDARKRIGAKEDERRRFLLAYHKRDPEDIHLYDIALNTAELGLDRTVDLLVEALEYKGSRLSVSEEQLGPGAGLTRYPP